MALDSKTSAALIAAALAVTGGAGVIAGNYAHKPATSVFGVVGHWETTDGITPYRQGEFVGIAGQIAPIDAGATIDASASIDASTGASDATLADAGRPSDASIPTDAALAADAGQPAPGNQGFLDLNAPSGPLSTPPGIAKPIALLPKPALLTPVVDATFNTTITRMPGESTVYSQLQAFSPDNAYYIAISAGDYEIRKTSDGSLVLGTLGATFGANAPRWRGASYGHQLFWIAASPSRIIGYDLDSKQQTELWRSTDAFSYSSRSEEAPSRDGRYTALYTHDAQSAPSAVYLIDMVSHTSAVMLTQADIKAACPGVDLMTLNWVAPSPKGTYLVLSWTGAGTGRCKGMELYRTSDGSFAHHGQANQYHSDLSIDESGNEWVVTVETDGSPRQCASGEQAPCIDKNPWSNNYQSIVMYDLNAALKPRYIRLIRCGSFSHISCQGRAGTCVLSGNRPTTECPLGPLIGEIGVLYLQTGNILRLAPHRSSECGYWSQSKATVSADGSIIAFASDWSTVGACSASNSSIYMMKGPF